jgi:hypothetical protein
MKEKIKGLNIQKILLNIVVVVALFFPTACNKSDDDADIKPTTPPEIPPESTFAADFSGFTDKDTTNTKSSISYHNWWFSASNVMVWNVIINVNMIVPVAAFRESFNHVPVYDPDLSSWIWSYNFFAQGKTHLAELHGTVMNDSVKWEMYITKQGEYSDFLWYHGISHNNNTSGDWHLNAEPNDPKEYIYIEWHRDPQQNEADIKYTNVKEGAPGIGGYIFYGVNEDPVFNAFYNIYNAQNNNFTEIEWHRTNENGRVSDEMHFGDTEWHCWDENLMDIICP